MAYFSSFPLVRLNDGSLGMNITARNKFVAKYKNDPNYFYEHTITEGETPEIIADKFYDDVELVWVIMIFNDMMNVYNDWPADQYTLSQFIDEKYDNPYAIHHYVAASTGAIVDLDYPSYDRVPVTNTEYEIALNDSKRKIKLLLPELVGQAVTQHKELMSRAY